MKARTALDRSVAPARRDRNTEFLRAASQLGPAVVAQTKRGAVAQGDGLALLKLLPTASVSLIVTDPPYHSTKKANITGDRGFPVDSAYLDWIAAFAQEWRRVLRPNGTLYLFCATPMAARLEVSIAEHLQPLSHITWTKPNDPGFDGWKGKMRKEALRRWYPHSERILFFEQAAPNESAGSALGAFLREARLASGLTAHQVAELTGAYGKVNHGGAVSNWETGRNVPSREQYGRLAEVLEATGQVDPLPHYEDVVRPFRVSRHVQFTDVWTFPSVKQYRGKHPAEKPRAMLAHMIESSSYEGDVVLDCFSGSGATLEAAITVNRHAIGFELEERWALRSAQRVKTAEAERPVTTLRQLEDRRRAKEHRTDPLF